MGTIKDLLVKQHEHIEWIDVCKRRQNEYSEQIDVHMNKLKDNHKELMRPILEHIVQSKKINL